MSIGLMLFIVALIVALDMVLTVKLYLNSEENYELYKMRTGNMIDTRIANVRDDICDYKHATNKLIKSYEEKLDSLQEKLNKRKRTRKANEEK